MKQHTAVHGLSPLLSRRLRVTGTAAACARSRRNINGRAGHGSACLALIPPSSANLLTALAQASFSCCNLLL